MKNYIRCLVVTALAAIMVYLPARLSAQCQECTMEQSCDDPTYREWGWCFTFEWTDGERYCNHGSFEWQECQPFALGTDPAASTSEDELAEPLRRSINLGGRATLDAWAAASLGLPDNCRGTDPETNFGETDVGWKWDRVRDSALMIFKYGIRVGAL